MGPPPGGENTAADGGANQQTQGWADPDCTSESREPLLAYAMSRSPLKQTFLVLTVAGAIACLGIAGVTAWNWRQTMPLTRPVVSFSNPAAYSQTSRNICLLQVTYGNDFKKIAEEITTPNRRHYAHKHGYRLLHFQSSSLDGLLRQFKSCRANKTTAHGILSVHAVLKYCAVLDAFNEHGCEAAMWMDGDAVIRTSSIRVEDWMAVKPDADVYWSFSNHPECWESRGCADLEGSMGQFVQCINTGVFIMKNTAWSRNFTNGLLQLSTGHHHSRLDCTSDVIYYGYNICQQKPNGYFRDQCIFACDALHNKVHVDHYACFGDNRRMQLVIYLGNNLKQQIYIPDNTYIVNCDCNGDDKLACLRACLSKHSHKPDGHHVTTGGPAGSLVKANAESPGKDDTCLVTVAIGLNYTRMSIITWNAAQSYAKKWKYRALPYWFDSPGSFMRWCRQTTFGGQFQEEELIEGDSLFKFCAVSHAMTERNCARVIFLSAGAVLSNVNVPFRLDWNGAVAGAGQPQVLFGLGQLPQGDTVENGRRLLSGSEIVPLDSEWCQSDNACGNFTKFWSCLNTGVFLMESTDEMHQFMVRVVRGMSGRNGISADCTTAPFNPWHRDQCEAQGIRGDQCMIGCAILRDNQEQGYNIDHMPDNFACAELQDKPNLQEAVTHDGHGLIRRDGTHQIRDDTYVFNLVGEHKRRAFMGLLKRYHHVRKHYNTGYWRHRLELWSKFEHDF
jgi:hypothetical protein